MPPRSNTAARSSLVAEALDFARNIADIPYDKISTAVDEAGFRTMLTETATIPAYDGTVLVTFDVNLGRVEDDKPLVFEKVDCLTVRMPPGPGPISVAARVSAKESLIYLLTGRLPPQKTPPVAQTNGTAFNPQTPAEQTVQMDDTDQELVNDEPEEAVRVVEHREADGLPIFVDLYSLGAPLTTKQVIDAVLDECHQFLGTASIEQVAALAAKNKEMMAFLKDLGEEDDLAELKKMVAERREALTLPPQGAAMRRRAASAARAN